MGSGFLSHPSRLPCQRQCSSFIVLLLKMLLLHPFVLPSPTSGHSEITGGHGTLSFAVTVLIFQGEFTGGDFTVHHVGGRLDILTRCYWPPLTCVLCPWPRWEEEGLVSNSKGKRNCSSFISSSDIFRLSCSSLYLSSVASSKGEIKFHQEHL